MHRAFQRTGWALAVAGGLSLAVPVLAAPPTTRMSRITPEDPGPGKRVGRGSEGKSAQFRGSAGRAGLARGPHSLPLSPQHPGPGRDADGTGFRPHRGGTQSGTQGGASENDLAGEGSNPGSSDSDRPFFGRISGGGAATARDLLAESFGDRARAVTVIIGRDGQITLLGMIASEADSLNVTRKLRQVPGCRYVVNQLMVSADPEFSPGPATIPAAPGSLPPANAGSSKGPGGLLPVAAAKPLAPPSKPTTPVVPVGHTGSSSPPSSPPAPRQDFSKLQGTQGVSSQLPEVSFRASTWGEQPLPAARSGGSTGSMVKDPANTPGPPLPLLPAKPAKIPSHGLPSGRGIVSGQHLVGRAVAVAAIPGHAAAAIVFDTPGPDHTLESGGDAGWVLYRPRGGDDPLGGSARHET